MREAAFRSASQASTENKEERRAQHQPGQDLQECVGGRAQEQKGSDNSSDHAGDGERDHHAPRDIEVLSIRAGTGGHAHPERHRVGGVRLDGRDAAEHECREGDKAAAAGDRVQRAAQNSGDKKEESNVEVQVTDLSHQRRKAEAAR